MTTTYKEATRVQESVLAGVEKKTLIWMARRIPAGRYVDPGFFAREQEKLWPTVWQMACTEDCVGQPGDYYEYRSGVLSALIVRGEDGQLRAFHNVCRHRGQRQNPTTKQNGHVQQIGRRQKRR